MAINRRYPCSGLTLPLTKATAQTASRTTNFAVSGDPVVIGQIPGVAAGDADSAGKVVPFIDGIFNVLVAGIDAGGTSGADRDIHVVGGDAIYFDKDTTPPLSLRSTGILWGYAIGDAGVELVASGATTTAINVMVGKG